ncbi:hypothetical protein Tco_1332489, partial [Tanacetum coccineum]
MFEDNSYKAYEAHNDLYEALKKSPPSLPPPSPPPAGASRSSQVHQDLLSCHHLLILHLLVHQDLLSKFESTNFMEAQELSPTDSLMQDDSIPDEEVHLSDDEDSGNV